MNLIISKIKEYAKKNNIRSYISDEDWEKLIKYINWKDYLEEKKCNDSVNTIKDYIYHLIEQYNYELAIENEDTNYMLKLIHGCDFDIEINKNGTLDIIDMQGAYLGGEDSWKNFDTISSVLGRISGVYLYDYFGINSY